MRQVKFVFTFFVFVIISSSNVGLAQNLSIISGLNSSRFYLQGDELTTQLEYGDYFQSGIIGLALELPIKTKWSVEFAFSRQRRAGGITDINLDVNINEGPNTYSYRYEEWRQQFDVNNMAISLNYFLKQNTSNSWYISAGMEGNMTQNFKMESTSEIQVYQNEVLIEEGDFNTVSGQNTRIKPTVLSARFGAGYQVLKGKVSVDFRMNYVTDLSRISYLSPIHRRSFNGKLKSQNFQLMTAIGYRFNKLW